MISIGQELPTVKLLTALPKKLEPVDAMGVLDTTSGVANRATFIFDPKNICQHVSVNAMDTGRNHTEILRTLLALKAGGLTSCSWEPGEELL